MRPSPLFPAGYDLSSVKVLEESLLRVPAYRSWKKFDLGPAVSVNDRFAALPAITKDYLRKYSWRSFVPDFMDADKALREGTIELVKTSGTTQEQITNIWYQPWWNASEEQSWRYNRHTEAAALGKHREAILTSPFNTGILSENGFLSMEERRQQRFLYLNEKANPSFWDENMIRRIIRELEIFQPAVLEANPSYLAIISRYAAKRELHVFQPSVIILTYENPGILSRRHIRQAFSAPLVSSYGSTEAGYVLMECEKGKMHQVSSSCRIDMEYLNPEYGKPHTARPLLTTLTNPWRSLIRFDAGDLVEIEEDCICACGRSDGYIIGRYAGRTVDLTYSVEGIPVTTASLEEALCAIPSVADYRLQQEAQKYHICIVTDDNTKASSSLREEIVEKLLPLYGEKAAIKVHFTDHIQTESSGKYRRTSSDIQITEAQLFAKRSAK